MAAVSEANRTCETPGCGKDAKLQCPTCIKLAILGSFFCAQVRFNQLRRNIGFPLTKKWCSLFIYFQCFDALSCLTLFFFCMPLFIGDVKSTVTTPFHGVDMYLRAHVYTCLHAQIIFIVCESCVI